MLGLCKSALARLELGTRLNSIQTHPQLRAEDPSARSEGEHHAWALGGVGAARMQHAQVHQPDVTRSAGHLHDLQLHIAHRARPAKEIHPLLRTANGSIRVQQVDEERLAAQKSPEL